MCFEVPCACLILYNAFVHLIDKYVNKIIHLLIPIRSFLDETKANCGPKASVIFTRTQQVLQNKLMQINQELTKALDEARASTESYIAEVFYL